LLPLDFIQDFAGTNSGRFDIALQFFPNLRSRFLHFHRKHFASAGFSLLDCLRELGDSGTDVLANLLDGILQHKLVECDEGECRVTRLDANAVSRRNFSDQPLDVNRSRHVLR
jgi:hypothetical protein